MSKSTPRGREFITIFSLLSSSYPSRQQFLVMEKAQMAVQYEQREAARHVIDWQTRGVFQPEELQKSGRLNLYSDQMKLPK